MRTRRAALFLSLAALFLAITVPLSIESAPAPKPVVRGGIEFVKPPAAMSLDKFRDQQITYLRTKSVHLMVVLARAEIIAVPTVNGFDCRYPNWFALSIVKEQKIVEAFLPKVELGTGRRMSLNPPAKKDEKKLESWLDKNLRIRLVGKRSIHISFAAGSKAEQASIINALLVAYRGWGPHVHRKSVLNCIKYLREKKLSREQRTLAALEADLPRLKKEVEKDKANLAWKMERRERDIVSTKATIKEYDDLIRKWQAEVEHLPPEQPRIRWAKSGTAARESTETFLQPIHTQGTSRVQNRSKP